MSENEVRAAQLSNQKICSPRGTDEYDKIHILDYLIVLVKRKWMIAAITLAAAVATGIYSLVLPNVYRATATIIPPQQSNSNVASQLLNQIAPTAGLAGGAIGMKSPCDLYIGLLKSKRIYDRIIETFGLRKLYGVPSSEDARALLDSAVSLAAGKDGIIIVSVEDKDPKLASSMANTMVEELKRLTQNLAITEAAQRRLFFEEQLREARQKLRTSEGNMQSFQEKTGALKIDDQASAVIQSIANLRAQVAAREVQRRVMETYSTVSNPEYRRVVEELKGLKIELARLETQRGSSPDPLVPTGRMPSLGAEYLRNMRDLKYNETFCEVLAKQYEIAKLDEAKDISVVQVLDFATPSERKARPKRTVMVIVATLVGASLSILLAFVLEYVEKLQKTDPDSVSVFKKHLGFHS